MFGNIIWVDRKLGCGAISSKRGKSLPFYFPKAQADFPEYSRGKKARYQMQRRADRMIAIICLPKSVVERVPRPVRKREPKSKALDAKLRAAIKNPYNYCKPNGGPVRASRPGPTRASSFYIVTPTGGRKPGGRWGSGEKHH